MKVVDAHGQVWRVSRRWVPWRRRGEFSDSADGLDFLDAEPDNPIGCLLWLVGLVVAIPTLTVMLIGLTFTVVELVLLAVLLPFAILGRVLFGRHWYVEVRHGFERVWEAEAGDWAASREEIHANADRLRRGDHPVQLLPDARDLA
ncbi:hypothetical protein [Nocardioides campestrisoli]|uniref:hypothetical protein n=1 Tax=Nocardioides campestrisoli TaxID=2736757 RepID=UPI00163D63F7|nr:hypothetical protein [Nocardioides campestrisoli]